MESRIKNLIEKYWATESTLKEEKEVKNHFRQSHDLSPEGKYFMALENRRKVEWTPSHPGQGHRRTWMSLAASITIGIAVAFVVLNDARNQDQFVVEDPQKAYEITKQALLMIGGTINEGGNYSQELDKINKAERVISDNKKSKK